MMLEQRYLLNHAHNDDLKKDRFYDNEFKNIIYYMKKNLYSSTDKKKNLSKLKSQKSLP